jgi:uncharacterized protein
MKKFLLLGIIICFTSTNAQCSLATAEAFQKQINKEYFDVNESPLKESDFKTFKGLDFFSINMVYCVEAKFIKTPNQPLFVMPTTGSRKPEYVKYGEVHFTMKGKAIILNIYQSTDLAKTEKYKNHLFLPFTDLTNGSQTYGGGRYIDLEIPTGNSITIDFNKAYNPYCAYNEKYSCPIPPKENDIKIEIFAGVRKFHD